MSEYPEPLVPAECELRDFPFTPIFRARLFGSGFHSKSTDAEWRAGVTLWLKSWDQSPSGSLPDDDVELCRLAELGRDLKAWRKVREGALRGWILCSDGRLYHRVVAEGVLEAWARKQAQRNRTHAAREARLSQRLSQSASASVTENATDTATEDVTASVTASKGQGQGQGIDNSCSKPDADAPDRTGGQPAYTPEFESFWSGYPDRRTQSKKRAFAEWRKLKAADRALASSALPAFVAHLAEQRAKSPTRQTLHAERYLSQRRFETLLEPDQPPASSASQDARWASMLNAHAAGHWSPIWGNPPGEPGCKINPEFCSRWRAEHGQAA